MNNIVLLDALKKCLISVVHIRNEGYLFMYAINIKSIYTEVCTLSCRYIGIPKTDFVWTTQPARMHDGVKYPSIANQIPNTESMPTDRYDMEQLVSAAVEYFVWKHCFRIVYN